MRPRSSFPTTIRAEGTEPSAADKAMISRRRQALALVDIRTLDHVIVAGAVAMSFAARGLL
ncbi:JAB domain-containing protein [Xanthomonas sacchari]|uniref:JAB domain-containing protein n=1 Tax=Xanthomonas sacchari TaxID=56458 RepID=UPI003D18A78B